MKKINKVTIIVTEKCNLRCTYCYVDKNSPTSLDINVVKEMPIFLNKLKKKYNISNLTFDLFGGEPLLEWNISKTLINILNEFIKKENINGHISIFSNGTTFTKEKLLFLKNNNVNIPISLDGGKLTHNKCRIYPNGKGSYNDVLSGIKLYCKIYNKKIKECDFKFMISPNNMNFVINSINNLMKDGIYKINSSIIRDDVWDKNNLLDLKSFYNNYVDFLTKSFFSENPFLDTGLLVPYYNIDSGRKTFCSAGGSSITIAPNGDIYPCQRFYNGRFTKTKMGDIFNDIDDYNNISNIYKSFNHDISSKCRNCDLYGVCYGQCFSAIMEAGHKNICEPIEGVCEGLKIFYNASIDYINNVGGYDNIVKKFNLKGCVCNG